MHKIVLENFQGRLALCPSRCNVPFGKGKFLFLLELTSLDYMPYILRRVYKLASVESMKMLLMNMLIWMSDVDG